MSGRESRLLGRWGESLAADYLRGRGYEILDSGWHCRFGELDLVARDRSGTVCFVEVKLRQTGGMSLPREAVDLYKQKKLILACRYLLTQLPPADWIIRFDVVEVCPRPAGGYEVHCIQDAFRAREF